MARPTPRRLTLTDLAILIAAFAFGLIGLRVVREERAALPSYVFSPSEAWQIDACPFLISACLALLIAGLIGPRPTLRLWARQPGTLACLMIFGYFLLRAAQVAVLHQIVIIFEDVGTYLVGLPIVMTDSWSGGMLVASSWVALALARRWRPEPNWIDRAGRMLGVIAIIGAIVFLAIP